MFRGRAFVLSAAALALDGAGAGVLLATHGGSARAVRTTGDMPGKASQASGKKTYAQLVAANYRILKPQQSARLLRYADDAFACMSQDLELGDPRTSPTKIVMTLPTGTKPSTVIRSMGKCATRIGDPPAGDRPALPRGGIHSRWPALFARDVDSAKDLRSVRSLECVECGRVSRENKRGWKARLALTMRWWLLPGVQRTPRRRVRRVLEMRRRKAGNRVNLTGKPKPACD